MIIIQEDEIKDLDIVRSLMDSIIDELLDLDSNFYIVQIDDNEWRLYYSEKSLLSVEFMVNSSSDNALVMITDYNGKSKIFNLDDQDDIQQYVVTAASKIL